MLVLDAQVEGLGVEDVGRVDDRRRIALAAIAGGQGPADLAAADRIDQRPVAAEQIEDRQVRAGLLGVADVVEGGQVAQPLQDHGRIVDEVGVPNCRARSATATPAISVLMAEDDIGGDASGSLSCWLLGRQLYCRSGVAVQLSPQHPTDYRQVKVPVLARG